MIVAYTGKLGQGKTYTMTQDIVKHLNKGVKVYSNYKIYWNGYKEEKTWWKSALVRLGLRRNYRNYPASNLSYWSETEEILDLENGIIAMDEGSVYLNSRNWALLDPEFQRKILQSRKDGLHIYFTAQRIGQIELTLRNLVNVFYVSTFRSIFGFKFFALGEFEMSNSGDISEEKRIGSRYLKLNTKQRLYDTNEKVASLVSTIANFAVQSKNRANRLAEIKKYEEDINLKLKAVGINLTVAEILKMEEQDRRLSVALKLDLPEEVQPIQEKRAVYNTVEKSKKPLPFVIPVRNVVKMSPL